MHVYRSYFRDDPQFDDSNVRHAAPHLPCPPVDRVFLVKTARAAIRANFGWPKPPETPPALDVDACLQTLLTTAPDTAMAAQPANGSDATTRLTLEVVGSGGGQWTLDLADGGELRRIEPGLAPEAAGFFLHIDTLAAIVRGTVAADAAIFAGRAVAERGSLADAELADWLQYLANQMREQSGAAAFAMPTAGDNLSQISREQTPEDEPVNALDAARRATRSAR